MSNVADAEWNYKMRISPVCRKRQSGIVTDLGLPPFSLAFASTKVCCNRTFEDMTNVQVVDVDPFRDLLLWHSHIEAAGQDALEAITLKNLYVVG